MVKVAPSLLAANPLTLGVDIKQLEEARADLLHIDVMDGHFVKNLGFSPYMVLAIYRITSLPLCVHLMVERPHEFIEMFSKCGVRYMAIHPETTHHIHKDLQLIRSFGIKSGVALNPGTPLYVLEPLWDELDFILVMGVQPGACGQRMLSSTFRRIQDVKRINQDKEIWIDGGVSLDNHRACIECGADTLVVGSDLFNHPPYSDRIALLKR